MEVYLCLSHASPLRSLGLLEFLFPDNTITGCYSLQSTASLRLEGTSGDDLVQAPCSGRVHQDCPVGFELSPRILYNPSRQLTPVFENLHGKKVCSDEISCFFNLHLYLWYQTLSAFGGLRLLTLISQILVNPDAFLRHI